MNHGGPPSSSDYQEWRDAQPKKYPSLNIQTVAFPGRKKRGRKEGWTKLGSWGEVDRAIATACNELREPPDSLPPMKRTFENVANLMGLHVDTLKSYLKKLHPDKTPRKSLASCY